MPGRNGHVIISAWRELLLISVQAVSPPSPPPRTRPSRVLGRGYRHHLRSDPSPGGAYRASAGTDPQRRLLQHRYPQLSGVMVGRALLAKPYLFCNFVDGADLERFHGILYSQYQKHLLGGEHQILTKMKSLWEYFLPDADKKLRKAIKKCNSIPHYEQIVAQIFKNYTIV